MDYNALYAVQSLELHLYSARIMKEHALFLKASFTPVNPNFAKEAEYYKQEFENLLCRTVNMSDGIVGHKMLHSGEIVTEFTACAEQQTQNLTGIHINSGITQMEHRLRCGKDNGINMQLCRQVSQLNQCAIRLLNGLIELKEKVLKNVLSCRMFTTNYPLLIEHIIREAKLYRTNVCGLENPDFDEDVCIADTSTNHVEMFWNRIMMEHALFIRGSLDPTENELIETAGGFAKDYARLLGDTWGKCGANASLEETMKFRDFKMAGVEGIEKCEIRSVILPLLADHVLREANHYIRLLEE